AYPAGGADGDRTMLDGILAAGLTPTVETDYERWKPLHWILAVPDVMEKGGFDAIVGNPPFLGGKKVSGATGTNIREWLVNVLAEGVKGNADLVANFLLRTISLLTDKGSLGIIATNTVAQGDTREVGLDRMVARGFSLTRAIQSRSWPAASANLQYAAVWGTRGQIAPGMLRVVDDVAVQRISTLLESAGRVEGNPVRLAENAGVAFQGCVVVGMGFVLDPDEPAGWIDADPKNAEVLFPYLNGEDLNSRSDASSSRWIIDFNNRPEIDAKSYVLPYQRVRERVWPERQKVNRKVHRERWWQYGDKRPALRRAITGFDEVVAITLVSNTVMPTRVPTGQVFSHKLAVFATDSFADQAVLSSNQHQVWAIKYGSTLGAGVNYSPSDVFITFPRPGRTERLAEVGKTLDTERREIMLCRDLGLTKLYNLVNDPEINDSIDPDVARLRQIHVELDEAVARADAAPHDVRLARANRRAVARSSSVPRWGESRTVQLGRTPAYDLCWPS
ncbi:MAG: BREX-1 system adenine-specific DNA-methyltransferase PglX, partial [Acidobacteria bacterium]|nr:BREX-1 system adenine-specific DNA-methyltransferase PglX [Acidobacteriota bacterium]